MEWSARWDCEGKHDVRTLATLRQSNRSTGVDEGGVLFSSGIGCTWRLLLQASEYSGLASGICEGPGHGNVTIIFRGQVAFGAYHDPTSFRWVGIGFVTHYKMLERLRIAVFCGLGGISTLAPDGRVQTKAHNLNDVSGIRSTSRGDLIVSGCDGRGDPMEIAVQFDKCGNFSLMEGDCW